MKDECISSYDEKALFKSVPIHKNHQGTIGTRKRAPSENITDSTQYHQSAGALLKEHFIFVPGQIQ